MVNNKIAQRAVAAGLSGLMAFGAAAPAALAITNYGNFRLVSTKTSDDSAHWKRLAGDNRYGTMKEIVKAYNEMSEGLWTSLRKGYSNKDVYTYHSTVVLASGDNFPDALAANGLAGYLTNVGLNQSFGANDSVPVLITKSSALTAETKDLLKGMQVQNVIIMGGTAAVSQDVEDAINKMGIGTSRVAGKDRQETSVKAMRRINGNWDKLDKTYDLIIASGNNYADALSISPYAYRMGTPIILTDKDGKLTDDEVAAIRDNDKIREIVIVGGTAAVKDEVLGQIGTIKNNRTGINVVRVAGVDRYETSAKIAEFEIADWSRYAYLGDFSLNHAIVATGENFPDALVGGQLAGGLGTTVDVDGFSVTDLNAWTPCPLLLTKDGDTRADSMIARALSTRWSTITSGTSTYVSPGSWANTWTEWYGESFLTDAALFKDWYRNVGPLYISEKAISAITLPGQVLPSTTGTNNFTFTVYNNPATGALEVNKMTIVGEGETVIDTAAAAINDFNVTVPNSWTVDYYDPIHKVNREVVIEMTAAEATDMAALAAGDTMVFTAKAGKWITRTDNTSGVLEAWKAEIVGFYENDNDFYGIILGGTKAVSNDKRDDLEKVVNDLATRNDIFTVGNEAAGTIYIVGDNGARQNYQRLVPVKLGAAITAAGALPTSAVSLATGAAAGFSADVYSVAGTSDHIAAIYNGNGDFVNWFYYEGAFSTVATDWNLN